MTKEELLYHYFSNSLSTEQNYYSTYKSNFSGYGQNAQDGYSLVIRIFSEFGIIGVFFLFLFIIRNLNITNPINISVLFLIGQLLIRGGHYTLYGTIFFFFLYYYTSKRKVIQNIKPTIIE